MQYKMRELLVATAALHAFTAVIIVNEGGLLEYACWAAGATAVSMAWHWRGEPADWLGWLDHAGAAGWLVFELALTRWLIATLLLNGAIFVLNRICAGSKQYAVHHSAWHVISALKCVLVARTCRG